MDDRSPAIRDRFEYDPETETYRTHRRTLPPSVAVVLLFEAILDEDPTSLDPLYEVIDTDALDSLLADETRGGDRRVEFAYCGHDVTVRSSGSVEAQPRASAEETDD